FYDIFFFSSRRRHTRWPRDWSSDVCSSDLNTARGALVDENVLVRALQEGWIAGAAVDAFAVEPLPADHALRKAPNVLLTPHLARSEERRVGKECRSGWSREH